MVKELKTVHGVIFHRQKYRDFDLLLRGLTQELGFVSILVRGGLRARSKLAATSLNFTYGTFVLWTAGKGVSTLRTVKGSQQFENIFSDLTKNAYASFILDLAAHAFTEYQPLKEYFKLITWALQRIDSGSDCEIVSQIVQLKMLRAFGLAPNLKSCTICGKEKAKFDYSISSGGLICSDHFASTPRLHLSDKEVSLLRTMFLLPIDRLGQIKVSSALSKRTHWAIDRIYRETADLNLKSKKFLEELKLLD